MEEKNMQFANFNITFGEQEEPMLTYFDEIIYPSFIGGYKRCKKNQFPIFSFADVTIKEIKGEYVLVGNYIKDTQYSVVTTVKDGELVSSPANIPTAPYSRFIIFLKNHRMVLIKNESSSPDIRSFQATVRSVMSQYRRDRNKELEEKDEKDKLPYSCINIVDIPLKDDIDKVLEDVNKINWVKLRFFPLNNDINPFPIAQAIDNEMKSLKTKTANVTFNSPESSSRVKKMIHESAGLAVATMEVLDKYGEKRKIKEDSFSSSKKIPMKDNIVDQDDEKLVDIAKEHPIITNVSEENEKIYKKWLEKFKNLLG